MLGVFFVGDLLSSASIGDFFSEEIRVDFCGLWQGLTVPLAVVSLAICVKRQLER
jgi:hypothetical protein